jgi:hypothetical protein
MMLADTQVNYARTVDWHKLKKNANSQDYAQKPQQNCTLMNSASGKDLVYLCSSSNVSERPELRGPRIKVFGLSRLSLLRFSHRVHRVATAAFWRTFRHE